MRLRIKMYGSVAVLLCAIAAAACGEGDNDGGRLSVVASIYPLGYFSERVGGDLVNVDVLIRPGIEAHGFEPTASNLRGIAAADVVVMNGLELEPWLERALDALEIDNERIVVETADESLAVEGFAHGHEGEEDEKGEEGVELDPHMWLDPTLAIVQVERIRDAFVSADAENAEAYRENASTVIDELNQLHADFTKGLAGCRHDHFVTSHAAYAYLAARYDAEQIPVSGLSPEVEPSPRQLAAITDQVKELGLGYVLVEPVLSGGLARTIARETGVELIPIHSIGSVTEDEIKTYGDYFGLMRNNLASLRLALECP